MLPERFAQVHRVIERDGVAHEHRRAALPHRVHRLRRQVATAANRDQRRHQGRELQLGGDGLASLVASDRTAVVVVSRRLHALDPGIRSGVVS